MNDSRRRSPLLGPRQRDLRCQTAPGPGGPAAPFGVWPGLDCAPRLAKRLLEDGRRRGR